MMNLRLALMPLEMVSIRLINRGLAVCCIVTQYLESILIVRVAVAAEYIAKGYSLSDTILQRAIELDSTSIFYVVFCAILTVCFRPARHFLQVFDILPIHRYDRWSEGIGTRQDDFRQSPARRQCWAHSSQDHRRTTRSYQKGWRCASILHFAPCAALN